MPKPTVHDFVYTLANALSHVLLLVDAGDIAYADEVEVTLKGNELKVWKGEVVVIETNVT